MQIFFKFKDIQIMDKKIKEKEILDNFQTQ